MATGTGIGQVFAGATNAATLAITLPTPPASKRIVLDYVSMGAVGMTGAGTMNLSFTPFGFTGDDYLWGPQLNAAGASGGINHSFPGGLPVGSSSMTLKGRTNAGATQAAVYMSVIIGFHIE